MKKINVLIFILILVNNVCQSQYATIFGVIRDAENNEGLELVNVSIKDDIKFVESNINGEYSIKIPANVSITLLFKRLGYLELQVKIDPMPEGGNRYMNAFMALQENDLGVTITASRIDDGGMVREAVSEFKILPSASGNFEAILPSIALGVNSGSGGELSSQYNVRGGNYDENLVYINDFEIFRPQLIRAGQQEGLSFPNIDLIRDVSFSSGGFNAKYGNKMSSVLDIRYKRPDMFKASIAGSLLGASAHIEGSTRLGPNAFNKFRYLIGVRYKTNKYLLGSLDVKGEYLPDFTDIQAYLTYDLNKSFQFGILANYNASIFNFTPETRSTTLGLLTNTLRFNTAYEGGERDKFFHGLLGGSLTFLPDRKKNPYFLKLMASRYSGSEQENFDILGYYRLSQIESSQNSSNFNEEIAVLGTGTQHIYARNFLYNEIYNTELRGGIEIGSNEVIHFVEFGTKYQKESYDDFLNEWERLDSAGYSLPYTGSEVMISKVLKAKSNLVNDKADIYIQDEMSFKKSGQYQLKLNGGLRATSISLNKEFLWSPRLQMQYEPLKEGNNISYKLAWGIYYQSPFYREFRMENGSINPDLKSQKSTHYVAGLNYDFMWSRISKKPFKLIGELYYKKLENLVSYDVDNVRIAYSGNNDSKGYATGLDLRVNGEFVPDAESWVNLSFLRTRESLDGITHLIRKDSVDISVKDVARPTDRLFNMSMFFQDYLPKNKNFKANINFSFATGLPFGRKDENLIYRNIFRYSRYQRLDIGFSYALWDVKDKAKKPHHPLRNTKNAWLSLEVFNIMGISNTASITWIKTITNQQFAINNNLTSRRVNLRFRIDF